jgi:phosphatidylserine/phosphatidylglycerophosphate/cardiolipin synthase-like enzyme
MAQTRVLGALGVVTGAPQQTRLVTPYQDAMKAFEAFISSATTSIRTMIFGCTLQPFFDILIDAKSRGLDVRIIFDHSQAEGVAEKAEIERLVGAGFVDGKDFVIGTSPQAHQLCHIKATWIDGTYVEDGSLNYSPSGLKQINTVAFTEWQQWAQYLDTVFADTWEYIVTHESAYETFTKEVQP